MAVTLEGEDSIHHMFQHPGTCQGSILGDVADQKTAKVLEFGQPHQFCSALPQLTDAAGQHRETRMRHSLDGVDDHQRRRH